MSMFTITIGPYRVVTELGRLPSVYAAYRDHAALCEEFDLQSAGELWFLAVGTDADWPGLVVAQRFQPGREQGFSPEVLVVLETDLVLIGAGERLLAYTLRKQKRLWEESGCSGFSGWRRYGDVLVMLGEAELAAWDLLGRKLWAAPVEAPWCHHVDPQHEFVQIDSHGRRYEFPLRKGPGLEAW
jgi:hypothetical protein